MHTIAEFGEKYGIPRHTIYAWLYRDQLEKHGIEKIVISGVQFLKLVSKKKLTETYLNKKDKVLT